MTNPIPEGYNSVTPYLVVDDAAKAIEFYKQAFGAEEKFRMKMPVPSDAAGGGEGGYRIGHAEIKNFGAAVGRNDYVRGLQVAVNHAIFVRVRERLADLNTIAEHRRDIKAAGRDEGTQCRSRHVLHGKVRFALKFSDFEQGTDVRMV